MKSLFIAGNWKSNKTTQEAKDWVQVFSSNYKEKPNFLTVVVCAPFTALDTLKQEIQNLQLPISLSAQNVSEFDNGPVTGEISAQMIKELADWVIIGHSSRRTHFGETDENLAKKVEKAKAAGLQIIYCIPDVKTPVPESVDVVAYEPVWAIGTGKSDTPQNANEVCKTIKRQNADSIVIYGGSVTDKNVISFVRESHIDGVLPGALSLDPIKFARLITVAITAS